MASLYPEIEPYDRGMLDVGGGHQLYWETCGNPAGQPIVLLHGGPGSGWNTGIRRYFNPSVYRIVLFDQRGCGRSTPHAGDIRTDLFAVTTEHLIQDIERLRRHLGVNRWTVFGGSWGCTLGVAYAERYPMRVAGAVFVGITTTRRSEIDWLYRGVAPLFPEQWERFRNGAPAHERDGDLVSAYHRLLENRDPEIHQRAAEEWNTWESALVSVDPNAKQRPTRSSPASLLAFARIVTHVFSNNAWLEDGVLLRRADLLAPIPAILIQGRIDFGAPMVTAWELSRAWQNSEFIVVDGAGHSGADPGMSEATIGALDRMATLTGRSQRERG